MAAAAGIFVKRCWRPRAGVRPSPATSPIRSVYIASALVSLVLLLAAGTLASAQSGPSREEQMACRSDAGKFCAEHVGKPPQMNACLRANKEKLSDGCRKVVESHGG
jgi:hypothetical protein